MNTVSAKQVPRRQERISHFSPAHHRSYQPLTPASSRLLQLRWDKSTYEGHRRKVASAKSTVDMTPPKDYQHVRLKLKRFQKEEERCAEIMRDNLTLLKRMAESIYQDQRFLFSLHVKMYDTKSLLFEKRRQELLKIVADNRAMFERLLATNSCYSVHRWLKEWEKTQQLIQLISSYPNSVTKK